MRKKDLVYISLALCVLTLLPPVAFAEGEATASPAPSTSAAPETQSPAPSSTPDPNTTAQPDESVDPLEGVVVKSGDEGDNVVLLQMRLRDLGYYTYKITGQFGSYTANAVMAFQKQNGLSSDGVAGQTTLEALYANTAKRKPVTAVVKPTAKPVANTVKTVKYGALKDWYGWVKSRFTRGKKVKVVDFYTGKSYYMIMVGGSNHADVEPATKKDCATLLSTYGGSWSYARRPVIVYIDGVGVAASTNGQPHGYETIANNDMVGQVCIHFLNSRTHGTNVVCPIHQACIKKAAGK